MFQLSASNEARARRLHEESIVSDSLGGAIMSCYAPCSQGALDGLDELAKRGASAAVMAHELDSMHVNELIAGTYRAEPEWMKASGVTAFSMTVGALGEPPFSFDSAIRSIALWTRKFDALDYLTKATCSGDIQDAKLRGKSAIIMNLQTCDHIGTDLDKINILYDLGVRIIQPTYNLMNHVGSGCFERTDAGLSSFGLKVLDRMNKLGILVDVSHCGHQTTADTIRFSSVAVAATHSFCRALHDHPRGKTDDELRALAERRGYFGVLLLPSFLVPPGRQPSLEDFLDHVEHAVEVMGVDKVGIGTDWGGIVPAVLRQRVISEEFDRLGHRREARTGTPISVEGYRDHRDWPNLTRGLVSRGYDDSQIRGLIGGNFVAILKQVEKQAS